MNPLKQVIFLSLGASMAIAPAVRADTPAPAAKTVKPAKISCEEFLALDEVTRPKIIYWADGFNRKGKLETVEFDTEKVDRLVPVMVEVCTKEPKASFWSRAKAEFKKIF